MEPVQIVQQGSFSTSHDRVAAFRAQKVNGTKVLASLSRNSANRVFLASIFPAKARSLRTAALTVLQGKHLKCAVLSVVLLANRVLQENFHCRVKLLAKSVNA